MIYLLVLAALLQVGCASLQRVDDKPICMLEYNTGIKRCEYDSWKACHAELVGQSVCYER